MNIWLMCISHAKENTAAPLQRADLSPSSSDKSIEKASKVAPENAANLEAISLLTNSDVYTRKAAALNMNQANESILNISSSAAEPAQQQQQQQGPTISDNKISDNKIWTMATKQVGN